MPVVIMQIHKIGAMWFQQQLLQLHYWQSAICLMVVIMRFLFFCKIWILFFCIFLFQWTIRIIVWNIGKKKNMEKSKSENRVYVCAMYLFEFYRDKKHSHYSWSNKSDCWRMCDYRKNKKFCIKQSANIKS